MMVSSLKNERGSTPWDTEPSTFKTDNRNSVLVRTQGLGLTYADNRGRSVRALTGIDLEIAEGEIVGLIGPSGCGKTTLLKVIAGLLQPTEGRCDLEPGLLAARGRSMTMVFQRPSLLNWLSVEENVMLPLRLAGTAVDAVAGQLADQLFRTVRLQGFRHASPDSLSTGMQMRVAIVRAFLPRPRLILMDEPLAALDEGTRLELSLEILRLVEATGTAVVIVSHALQDTVLVSNRILRMSPRPGRIVQKFPLKFGHSRDAALLDQPEFLEACAKVRAEIGHA